MGKVTVNISNASSAPIWVQFTADQVIEKKSHHSGKVTVQGAGIKAKREVEKDHRQVCGPGRSSVGPGKSFPFSEILTQGRAKLSIKKNDNRTLVQDYTVTEDINFIVTDSGWVPAKNKSTLWIDNKGKNHEPKDDIVIKESLQSVMFNNLE